MHSLSTVLYRNSVAFSIILALLHALPARAQVSGYAGQTHAWTGQTIPARAADPESFFPAGSTPRVTPLPPAGSPAVRRALITWELPALQHATRSPISGQRFCGGMFVRERLGGQGADRWEIVKQHFTGPAGTCTATWTPPSTSNAPLARLDMVVGNLVPTHPNLAPQSQSLYVDLLHNSETVVVPGGPSIAPETLEAVTEQLASGTVNPTSSFLVSLHRLTATSTCDVGGGCDYRWYAQVGTAPALTDVAPYDSNTPFVRARILEGPPGSETIQLRIIDEDPFSSDLMGSCSIRPQAGLFAAAEAIQGAVLTTYSCGGVDVTMQVRHVVTPTLSGPTQRDIDAASANRFIALRSIAVDNRTIELPTADKLAARIVTTELLTPTTSQLILDTAFRSEPGFVGWAGRLALSLRWQRSTWVFDSLQSLSLRQVTTTETENLIRTYSTNAPQPATPVVATADPRTTAAPAAPDAPPAVSATLSHPPPQPAPGSPSPEAPAREPATRSPASLPPVAPPPVPEGLSRNPFHVVPLSVPSLIARVEFRDSGVSPEVNQALLDKFRAALATAAAGEPIRRLEALVMQRALAAVNGGRRGDNFEIDARAIDFRPNGRPSSRPSDLTATSALLNQSPIPRGAELEPIIDALVGALRLPRMRPARRARGVPPLTPTVELEVRVVWQRTANGSP